MKRGSFEETSNQARSDADSRITYTNHSSSTVFPAKVRICVQPIMKENILFLADREHTARGSKRTISSEKTPDSN